MSRPAQTYRQFRRANSAIWYGVEAKRSEEDAKQVREETRRAVEKKQGTILLRNREDSLRFSESLYPGFYPCYPTWEDLYRSKRIPETGGQEETQSSQEATSRVRY